MLHRLILKVTKFQLLPPKRLGTVIQNISGGHHAPSPLMSNRVKAWNNLDSTIRNLPNISQFKKAPQQLIRPKKEAFLWNE